MGEKMKFVYTEKNFVVYVDEIESADSPILHNTMNELNLDSHGAALFLAALQLYNGGFNAVVKAESLDLDGYSNGCYPFFNYKDVFNLDGFTSPGVLTGFKVYKYPFVKWKNPKFDGTANDIDLHEREAKDGGTLISRIQWDDGLESEGEVK